MLINGNTWPRGPKVLRTRVGLLRDSLKYVWQSGGEDRQRTPAVLVQVPLETLSEIVALHRFERVNKLCDSRAPVKEQPLLETHERTVLFVRDLRVRARGQEERGDGTRAEL